MSEFENLVSIIIPCYNAQKFIGRCLSTLERQTYKNIEVVVVDDCSSDKSFETISNLKEQLNLKIIVEKNKENLGPSLTRQKGVSISTGDYICFCDSDDWYDDIFVERMLSTLIKNNSDIVFCGYKVVNQNNKEQLKSTPMKMIQKETVLELIWVKE